jgi:hypothetical protein
MRNLALSNQHHISGNSCGLLVQGDQRFLMSQMPPPAIAALVNAELAPVTESGQHAGGGEGGFAAGVLDLPLAPHDATPRGSGMGSLN